MATPKKDPPSSTSLPSPPSEKDPSSTDSPDDAVPQKKARELVKELVGSLHKFKGFNISEIVEGGSMGHGTAVLDHYDIDLVIYSRDITGDDMLKEYGKGGCKKWLIQLHQYLQEQFVAEAGSYKKTAITTRSLQFKFKMLLDVDLLISPYYENEEELYNFLTTIKRKRKKKKQTEKRRNWFTVGASKWQVQFFKKQPPQVKEYIRKAKAWRNEKWPLGVMMEGRPSSYLMSLLVVKAYEKDKENVTDALIKLVENADDRFNLTWDDQPHYRRRDYCSLLPSRPRVLDPANPANNVWKTGLKDYKPGERPSDYEPGDGNRRVLKSIIHTIKL